MSYMTWLPPIAFSILFTRVHCCVRGMKRLSPGLSWVTESQPTVPPAVLTHSFWAVALSTRRGIEFCVRITSMLLVFMVTRVVMVETAYELVVTLYDRSLIPTLRRWTGTEVPFASVMSVPAATLPPPPVPQGPEIVAAPLIAYLSHTTLLRASYE